MKIPTKTETKLVVALADLGTSLILVPMEFSKKISVCKFELETPKKWDTSEGTFTTHRTAAIKNTSLPQFMTRRKVSFKFNLYKKTSTNRIILGRYFMTNLGLDL